MNLQYALIILLFTGALFYLGRLFYLSFYSKKNSCGGNCGCSAIDLEKIEKQMLKGKEAK